MTPKEKKLILAALDECVSDIDSAIAVNRYEPSERGAGTATTDQGLHQVKDLIFQLLEEVINGYGNIDIGKLMVPSSFEEIQGSITMDNMHDFDELEEVDSFVRDNGERKYSYQNTVFRHRYGGRFLCVEVQCSADGETDIAMMQALETEKKEVVTYKWA